MTGLRVHRRLVVATVTLVGAGVLTAGVVAVGLSWAGPGRSTAAGREPTGQSGPRSPGPSSGRPGAAVTLPAAPARRTGALRPEVPTTSRLPNGTVVPIRPAGIAADGSLGVPDDIRVAGWWRGGSRLGDPFGSTLLAAHVDSFTQGLGPFSSLLSVRPGQRIEVASARLHQTFAVTSLRLVPRGTLAQHPGIFSARGPRRLTLVTCAGPYVVARGGYQNLAVITATPVSDVTRSTT